MNPKDTPYGSINLHRHILMLGYALLAMLLMQPALGRAGAGLVVEDALILGSLLGSISSIRDLDAAFKVFDIVRRPRCQAIIDSGRETSQVFCGKNPDTGLDADKIGGGGLWARCSLT
jgi:hypothetical protein